MIKQYLIFIKKLKTFAQKLYTALQPRAVSIPNQSSCMFEYKINKKWSNWNNK